MTKLEAALSLTLVGDLSFEGPRADRPAPEWFASVAPAFRKADLTIGNLESPLVDRGTAIPGKCTLRGTTKWAGVLRDAGIGLVTLANNHTMDYGPEGLRSTMHALTDAGIQFVGAGLDSTQACAPALLDIGGVRLACLGRTSVIVEAPTRAGRGTPGIAWLDQDETCSAIRRCRQQADLVLLLVHWGLEEYRYPSPAQRRLARALVAAGADVIVGHHPHVVQGIERIGSSVVMYSLGNFVFSNFEWQYRLENGTPVKTTTILTEEDRQGLLARLTRSRDRQLSLQLHPTRIDPQQGAQLDPALTRTDEIHVLSSALDHALYRPWWYAYSVRREWALRLGRTLSPKRLFTRLHKLRLHHLLELVASLRRSTKIVSECSRNPFE
jgi:poly-gamma-glutamate capsule biosynthesis protein CapA/YwtB (metallophosphatase superfamily)